jgi:transcriptional regulator with XRE-family HTH domain
VPPRATPHPVLKKLGRFVRQTRVAKDMSQEDLAGVAGLDRTYISHLERGLRNPSLLHLQRLAKALGIRPSDFFDSIA